ncbi:class I SAM-dependent methyltransferase [Desulfuromonas acetoxidans]|uniref:class I SAM-dependent methyltransferase n=1 Tax=Desulfuromonas acetoxidans TaxID=891 RepID=UPI00292E3D85|nr:class I SAM-dependent methyltransferase [Desulfuromonas acetoxidans]
MHELASTAPHVAKVKTEQDHRQRIKHSLDKAEKYSSRKLHKHAAEMALISRAVDHLSPLPRTWLDAPCGVGRATILLAHRGLDVTGVDLGEGALHVAQQAVERQDLNARIEKADLLDLPYSDQQFDGLLCFRLIHHLPTPQHRREIIDELCRVTKDTVLISYLSPWSPTSVKRALRCRLTGRKSVQNITPMSELKKHFSANGFTLINDLAQLPLVHSLHLAVFKRHSP